MTPPDTDLDSISAFRDWVLADGREVDTVTAVVGWRRIERQSDKVIVVTSDSGRVRSMGAFVRATPMKRLARPKEVADAVLTLFASSRAAFITGQIISLSGGLTMAG